MFSRLAQQYRAMAWDLVLSLQALAESLQERGQVATCYVCGDENDHQGASFVSDLGDGHTVRFLVSDIGISWMECRDGRELVKLEGAEAIQELQRIALQLQALPADESSTAAEEDTVEAAAVGTAKPRQRRGKVGA